MKRRRSRRKIETRVSIFQGRAIERPYPINIWVCSNNLQYITIHHKPVSNKAGTHRVCDSWQVVETLHSITASEGEEANPEKGNTRDEVRSYSLHEV
jgi:hypothetical protein